MADSDMLTIEKIHRALPLVTQDKLDEYGQVLILSCGVIGVYSTFRKAAFLSQIGYESIWFTHVEENLNYSPEALVHTWPAHFPDLVSTTGYARNPEKIANKVYANRMGNGDESSGDGWKFRGRGLLQLTGKDNYTAYSAASRHDCIIDPDYVASPFGAVGSACWFWEVNKLNAYADAQNIPGIVKVISGGNINLSRRIEVYNEALKALGG